MVAYLALRDTPIGDTNTAIQAEPEQAKYHSPNEDIAHLLKTLGS